MISGVFTILIYAQTTVNTRHIFIDISVTMGQRKVITICMDSYRLTLYISSVVYMLASRGPILKLYPIVTFITFNAMFYITRESNYILCY